jgi:hypothetical protein
MDRRTLTCAAALLGCLLAATAADAGALSIRLVEAHNDGPKGAGPGLGDVADVLARNIPYQHFDLADRRDVTVPGTHKVSMRGGYVVNCSGSVEALEVSIRRGRKSLLNTQLSLRAGKPVVLGGFPGGRGKYLVVLVASR